jgi:hypothetical protein
LCNIDNPVLVHWWGILPVTGQCQGEQDAKNPRQLRAKWCAAVKLNVVRFLAQKLH